MEEIISNYAPAQVRELTIKNREFIVRRLVGEVTEENVQVLQFLDCLKDIDRCAEENMQVCGEILAKYAREHAITKSMIDWFSANYPIKIYKAILGGRKMVEFFDEKDRNSIFNYALKMKGKKISDLSGIENVINPKDKGAVGNRLQEYFGIPKNSSTEPDFEEAKIELKTFGYWNDDGKVKADQRLALSKINFMEFEKEVPFVESHLYRKCRTMLFIAYLLRMQQARMDSEIKHVRLYEFDKIVKSDLEQIKKDYNNIIKKIRDGKASQLSEGDTEFLGAARTGEKNSKLEIAPKDDEALPRRFVLKHSYMSYLIREYIEPEKEFDKKIPKSKKKYQIKIPRGKSFEEWLNRIDSVYGGKTARKIAKLTSIKTIVGSIDWTKKNAYQRIGQAMLGIKSNKDKYLLMTNTVVKSVRISKTGRVKEDWSFPNFCVEDIIYQEWEESEVFSYLSEQRILMQIFIEKDEDYVYAGHLFLKFTPEQLDEGVKDTWEDFKKKITEGIDFKLVKNKKSFIIQSEVKGKTEGQIGVIKLHAGDVTYDIDRNHITGSDAEATKVLDENTVNGRFVWKPNNKEKYGCTLPNGDVITKQSFWLNRDFVLEYIRENRPDFLYDKE